MESPYELLRQEFEQARSCFIQNRKNKFCILCRRYKPKDIVLSHVIPHSVLKSTDKSVHKIGLAGQEMGPSRLGYRGYCKSCEGMLSRGERHFNQLMHAPLVDNHNSAIHVRSKDAAAIYHCAISMWWRFSTLSSLACEKSSEGEDFRKLLERVRVWLHKPNNTLPFGLQVFFVALHSEDLSCLRKLGLGLAATGFYGTVQSPEDKLANLTCMGPLHIKFVYLKLSCFPVSSPIDIPAGDARQQYSIQNLAEFMTSLRDIMLNLELRTSKEVPPPSAHIYQMRNMDIIPEQIAAIDSKTAVFHYHRLIRVETCRTTAGNVKLELYKYKKAKGDEPPYDALATLTQVNGRIRIWLQSDPTGKSFEFHKDITSRLPFLVDFCVAQLKSLISEIKLP